MKIEKEIVYRYVADDGKKFVSEEACLKHETSLKLPRVFVVMILSRVSEILIDLEVCSSRDEANVFVKNSLIGKDDYYIIEEKVIDGTTKYGL